MVEITYKLTEEYIELYKLLKINRLAATGGHAKIMIENGEVVLNGDVEFRKRAKIRSGGIVKSQGQIIKVI
jgi:ribosome-associated protein